MRAWWGGVGSGCLCVRAVLLWLEVLETEQRVWGCVGMCGCVGMGVRLWGEAAVVGVECGGAAGGGLSCVVVPWLLAGVGAKWSAK